jgi:prenyltransferase beta subunit
MCALRDVREVRIAPSAPSPDGWVVRMHRSCRSIGIPVVIACMLVAGLVLVAPASARPVTPATSAQPARIVGGTGSCGRAKGVIVAVSFRRWHGPIRRGCALHAATGLGALNRAGFTTRGTRQDGPAFVCRIGNPRFRHGRRFPTAAQDPCVRTPPANAFWSYWTAARGHNHWRFSRLGAAAHHPRAGEADAWVFGAGKRPGFTPRQVRAGLHTPATAATTAAAVTHTHPNMAAATRYLTDRANLVDGNRYAAAGTNVTDYGLSMDAAIALAASGAADNTLRAVTNYVFAHADRYTGIGTEYASGGAIGKEALLAEVTDANPRAVNGHDLVAALDASVCSGTSSGCTGAGNYRYAQSTFAQAIGVIARLRAGDAASVARPLAFLTGLQADSGAFPSVLPGHDADVDSTAAAAMALDLAGRNAAAQRALTWIAGRQLADGSFPGAAGHSTNSTGLAVQALSLASTKYRDAIGRAQAFLARQQSPDGGFAVANGNSRSDLRATTQVVSGAFGMSLGTVSDDLSRREQVAVNRARAVRFLTSSLTHGTHLAFAGGHGPNYGGTADLAVALAAAGGHDHALRTVLHFLVKHVDAYVDPRGKQSFPGPFTGAAGKLAVLAEITDRHPRAFGGVNLLHVLTSNVCKRAKGGQFGPCSAKGDFYQAFSTVGQALGVLALARAHASVPRAALRRLVELQCADGGFSSTLITGRSKCKSDVDSTGFALEALVRVRSAKVQVTRAIAFLRTRQRRDGGWLGAAGENTNSTALAIQGLLAAGSRSAAVQAGVRRAMRFLARRQNGNGGFGISAASPKSDILASTQAVPAIYRATLSRLSHPVRLRASRGGRTAAAPGAPRKTATAPMPRPAPSSSAPAAAGTASSTGPLVGLAAGLIVVGATLTALARRRRTARGHGN